MMLPRYLQNPARYGFSGHPRLLGLREDDANCFAIAFVTPNGYLEGFVQGIEHGGFGVAGPRETAALWETEQSAQQYIGGSARRGPGGHSNGIVVPVNCTVGVYWFGDPVERARERFAGMARVRRQGRARL